MHDNKVRDALRQLTEERDWAKFHSPENLAKSISIEAAELLECFQWNDSDLESAEGELSDVLTYCLLLADRLGLDPEVIVLKKLTETKAKYPIEKSHGCSAKYDRL